MVAICWSWGHWKRNHIKEKTCRGAVPKTSGPQPSYGCTKSNTCHWPILDWCILEPGNFRACTHGLVGYNNFINSMQGLWVLWWPCNSPNVFTKGRYWCLEDKVSEDGHSLPLQNAYLRGNLAKLTSNAMPCITCSGGTVGALHPTWWANGYSAQCEWWYPNLTPRWWDCRVIGVAGPDPQIRTPLCKTNKVKLNNPMQAGTTWWGRFHGCLGCYFWKLTTWPSCVWTAGLVMDQSQSFHRQWCMSDKLSF